MCQGTRPQKDQTLWSYLTTPPYKLRDPSRLVDTSFQVSTPGDVEMAEASLEEVPTTISPIAMTPESRGGNPPTDANHL